MLQIEHSVREPNFRRNFRELEKTNQLGNGDIVLLSQVRRFHHLFSYHHGFECEAIGKYARHEAMVAQLPAGGLVAHSVGAGKTVIAISLLAQPIPNHKSSAPCVNAVFVPNHILDQWANEIVRFCPQLDVHVLSGKAWKKTAKDVATGDVVLISYDCFVTYSGTLKEFFKKVTIHRAFFDEPQDIVDEEYWPVLVELPIAKHRWALSATPWPLERMLELVWGEPIPSPFDKVLLSAFLKKRARRDPPGECLPVPPLNVYMLPVELTWQESTVIQMYKFKNNLQAIRLCSYFAKLNSQGGISDKALRSDKQVREFNNMDDWITYHKNSHLAEIEYIKEKLHPIAITLSKQKKAARAERKKKLAKLKAETIEEERLKDEWIAEQTLIIKAQIVEERKKREEEEKEQNKQKELEKQQKQKEQGQEPQMEKETQEPKGKQQENSKQKKKPKRKMNKKYVILSQDEIDQLQAERRARKKYYDENPVKISQTDNYFDYMELIDQKLLRQEEEYLEKLHEQERLLSFLNCVTSTLSDPDSECCICFEDLQEVVVTVFPCLHVVCATCVSRIRLNKKKEISCPMCRVECSYNQLSSFSMVSKENEEEEEEDTEFFGSKVNLLVKEIKRILSSQNCKDDKIIIFAQWLGLLQEIHTALLSKKVKCDILSTEMKKRCEQLENFKHNPNDRILLLSYQHQASGINLDSANHVFIVHPYCPPNVTGTFTVPLAAAQSFEQQAVARVHRYPQSKQVHVYRLYARGTPEEELYTHWGWIS